MSLVLGLDPGYRESAYVAFDGDRVLEHEILENSLMLFRLEAFKDSLPKVDALVIEQISMGGMIAGAEIFETCFWSGRFAEMWSPHRWYRIKRKDVKLHIAGRVHAKDANIRAAIIERFGPDEETAKGTKKQPGPLYGIKSHEWAALAVALTWWDKYAGVDLVRPGVAAQF